MPLMNMIQALNSAMDIMLGRDPNVVILGEDVGFFGGVFRDTDGLQRKYGEHRVLDTPIARTSLDALAEAMEVPLMTSESSCEWVMNCREEYIQCNRDALVGAVLNLVNNAIQAVERKAHLRIEFNTYPHALKSATDKHRLPLEQEAPRLWIRVCDKGPGMAPELLNAVGDLFVTTKAQGTGLGLSVVQAVARAHHGKFLLQSTVGKGTCASLLIPFATFQSQGN